MNIKKYIDFKLFKYLTLFYTLVVIINLSKKCYWKIKGYSFQQTSWFDLVSYNVFLDWVVVLFFMLFISYFTKITFEKAVTINWGKLISLHLFLAFFIGYFIFFITGVMLYLLNAFSYTQFLQNLSLNHFISVVELNFLVYFSMVGIINVYYYIKKVKNIEIQRTKAEANLNKTRLNMLKSQLHPHFVFNTLNSISSLIEIDKKKAQNLIADFSGLFRDILEHRNDNLITLKEELQILSKYLEILGVRFSDHMIVKLNVQEKLDNIFVPNLILQPLIENSIKHGFSYNNNKLIIDLSIQGNDNYLFFNISNNGDVLTQPFHELKKKGMGLSNTYDRLKLLYHGDFEFKIYNKKDNDGVEVFIKIPIID